MRTPEQDRIQEEQRHWVVPIMAVVTCHECFLVYDWEAAVDVGEERVNKLPDKLLARKTETVGGDLWPRRCMWSAAKVQSIQLRRLGALADEVMERGELGPDEVEASSIGDLNPPSLLAEEL